MLFKSIINKIVRPVSQFFSCAKQFNSVKSGLKTVNNKIVNTFSKHIKFNKFYYTLPFIMYGGYKFMNDRKAYCQLQFTKNNLEERGAIIQYAANDPLEDRFCMTQLSSIGGYVVSVFDGHCGGQVSEYAMKNLHKELENALYENKGVFQNPDEYIQMSIYQAFHRVEQQLYQKAEIAYLLGFPAAAMMGSCALMSVVVGNKVYSANLGDCKGIIVNIKKGEFELAGNNISKDIVSFRKLNHKQNANSRKEQKRLIQRFPDEEDIIVCRNNEACYVKNLLQPTRTLGDFRLKYPLFNNNDYIPKEFGYSAKIENFNGPYISAIPEQQIFELDPGDRYLVLGTDGLWDELTKTQVATIVLQNQDDKDRIPQVILNETLLKASDTNQISIEQIKEIPLSKRRDFHDDITILVIDLQKQTD